MKHKKHDKDRVTISLMQYYYIILWLPVILPPFIFIYPFFGSVKPVVSPLFYAVGFGVLQYAVFALWSLFKYRNAVTRELQEVGFKAPIAFIPFYAVGFIAAYIFSTLSLPGIDTILMLLVFSLLCVPIGYFYVALAHILRRILEKIGFIEQEFI